MRGGIAFHVPGVSQDHTYFLSSPSGLKTRALWVAQAALANAVSTHTCTPTHTHTRKHIHTDTHTPYSSPRETWLLWRQSNQAAVTMETEVIGPFCVCVCPLPLSASLVTTGPCSFVQLLSEKRASNIDAIPRIYERLIN